VEDGHQVLRFQAELDLDGDLALPPDAEVIVEAYSGPVIMRFPFGTVASRTVPADTSLIEFPPGLKPLFRVKVVDSAEGDRRLLAWANAVTPLSPEEVQTGRRSIFPVELVDLGPLIWDVRLEDNTPILQLNAQIREPRDITVIAREPDFIALVYPAAIRRVFEHLLLGPERDNVEADHEWLRFGQVLAGETPPRQEDFSGDDDGFRDEVDAWINEVIKGFCTRQDALSAYVHFRKEADEANA
jgi:hypothetical protein